MRAKSGAPKSSAALPPIKQPRASSNTSVNKFKHEVTFEQVSNDSQRRIEMLKNKSQPQLNGP
jgi:hypothetical protein